MNDQSKRVREDTTELQRVLKRLRDMVLEDIEREPYFVPVLRRVFNKHIRRLTK
jgi:hypothetical protein